MVRKAPLEDSKKVLKYAGAAGLGTFFSRILGLVREQVFAVFFGAGFAMDAFNIAFRIPNLLRDLFAEGAMSAAFIPTFVGARKLHGEKRGWRVAGLVFKVLAVFTAILTIVGILCSEQLVDLYASAFREVPGKFELTVALTQLLFPFFPLIVLSAAVMAVLNALGFYFVPAFGSAVFNAVSIVTGVGLSQISLRWGIHPIAGMALGVVLGGMAQLFWQLPFLRKAGFHWKSKLSSDPVWHQDPALRKIMILMIPGVMGLAATQINILVNSILATSEGTGAVSWLNYAFRLTQFPIGVFGVSLAVATLPLVSELWVSENYEKAHTELFASLKKVFAINLPATAGLVFLSIPIVSLVFEYGRFSSSDTLSTAYALMAYSVGLVFYSAVKVLVPACYAFGKTKFAVYSSVISVILNLIFNLWFVKLFGYWGLALGTSLTALLNFLFLLGAIRLIFIEKSISPQWGLLALSFIKSFIAAAVMGGACYYTHQVLSNIWNTQVFWIRLLHTVILIAEGMTLSLLSAKILKIEELQDMISLIKKRLFRK